MTSLARHSCAVFGSFLWEAANAPPRSTEVSVQGPFRAPATPLLCSPLRVPGRESLLTGEEEEEADLQVVKIEKTTAY